MLRQVWKPVLQATRVCVVHIYFIVTLNQHLYPQFYTMPSNAALSKRRGAAASGKGDDSALLKFYTSDSTGLQLGPTAVLVMCLLFVGCVVILHIWGKIRK